MDENRAHTLLQQFNQTIDTFIEAVNDYTLEQLQRPPRPGSWSLGQMYMHIIDDTGWFVEQMQTALQTRDHHDEDMHEDAKAMFGNNSFPDIMIEGPATNTHIPQPQSGEQLQHSLQAIKERVNRLDFSQTYGKTKHPGLLYFNALEWLQFAEIHMRHHFRQKKRIDEKLF